MGELIFDVIEGFIELCVDFIFSPKFIERLPRPVRVFFRIFFILILIALLGLIAFAGVFSLISFFKKGSSVWVLVGGIVLLGALIGFIAFLVRTLRKRF